MANFRRRENIDAFIERLRLASSECSGLGLEETEEGEVEQTASASIAPREYCERCHISFGLAEKRVAVALGKVMHEDCYAKHLNDEHTRSSRIHAFTPRIVH